MPFPIMTDPFSTRHPNIETPCQAGVALPGGVYIKEGQATGWFPFGFLSRSNKV